MPTGVADGQRAWSRGPETRDYVGRIATPIGPPARDVSADYCRFRCLDSFACVGR